MNIQNMSNADLLSMIKCITSPYPARPSDAAMIHIDLETWGKKPGCAIRSIGASVINARTGIPSSRFENFYANVCDTSCEAIGLIKDPDTEKWRDGQSAEAQAAFKSAPIIDISAALRCLKAWYTNVRDTLGARVLFVWGNGKEFDISILEHCYTAVGQEAPWPFWASCDVRTIVWLGRLLGIDPKAVSPFNGTPHYSLDDATHQGTYTGQITATIKRVWDRGLSALQEDVNGAGTAKQLQAMRLACEAGIELRKNFGHEKHANDVQEMMNKVKERNGGE